MPGVAEAIKAFLDLLNKSGVPEQIKSALEKRREDEKKLHDNVLAMKDAPAPKQPGGTNG